ARRTDPPWASWWRTRYWGGGSRTPSFDGAGSPATPGRRPGVSLPRCGFEPRAGFPALQAGAAARLSRARAGDVWDRPHRALPGPDAPPSDRQGVGAIVAQCRTARGRRCGGTRVRGPEDLAPSGRRRCALHGRLGDPRDQDQGRAPGLAGWGEGWMDGHVEGAGLGPFARRVPRFAARGAGPDASGPAARRALGRVSAA